MAQPGARDYDGQQARSPQPQMLEGSPLRVQADHGVASPGDGSSKRQRLTISRVATELSKGGDAASPRSTASRAAGVPAEGSTPTARGAPRPEPRPADYSAGPTARSPGVGANYFAGSSPASTTQLHSPPSGEQWVWRHDAPNPNGSYGAWVWMPAPPLPPPGRSGGYYSAGPGAWGPATPAMPTGCPGHDMGTGYYHAAPGTPHTPASPYAAWGDGGYGGPVGPMPPPGFPHAAPFAAGGYPAYGPPPPHYGPPATYMHRQHPLQGPPGRQYQPSLQGRPGPQYQPMQGAPPGRQPQVQGAPPGRQPQLQGAPPGRQPQLQGEPPGRQPPGPRTAPSSGPPRDPAIAAAINCNKRITAATQADEIFQIIDQESSVFDTVCLATAMHKLANLRGAPNLHASIVQAPEFFKLKQLILQRRSEFTARNLSNTLWSLAKINHHPGDDFLAALAEEVKGKAAQGNAQNVANMVWAYATLGFHPGDDVMQALADAAKQKLEEFTSQNMSNLVLAFAKLEFDPGDELLEGLAAEALRKITSFSPQALSNTLWGLSRLGIKAPELMEGIGQAARSQLYEYNSQNLANSVWAYANIGVQPGQELMQDFARAAIQRMPEFSPQNISNMLWAYAKLDTPNSQLFVEAGKHAARIMHIFTPQSIANMIWSFATLGECPDPTFLHALVTRALHLLPEFSPQNLSNTAWALATLKECEPVRAVHKGLLSAISTEVTRRLLDVGGAAADFSRQHLANFVWALATLEYDPGKRTLMCVAEALVNRADKCNSQEVSNSVWAFAKLGHYDGALMNTMAAEATRRIDEFSQQNLSNMAWAYAKLAHLDDALMTAIADSTECLARELSLQHCTNIIWAYSSLKWSTPTLMHTLVAEVKARMADMQFNVQQLCNLLWSLAISEQCDQEVWQECMRQLAGLDMPYKDLPSEALTQVFQAYMLMLAEQPEVGWPIPEDLLARGQHAWVQTTKKIKISEFHAEVSRMMTALGQPHTIEHLTEDHLFSVDIALPEERIAMEVDGPHHFTSNSFRPLGEMYCRHTLLKARGWRVVSIPFYHWSGETDEGRQALLQRMLREARAAPVPQVHPAQAALSARLETLRKQSEAGAAPGLQPGWLAPGQQQGQEQEQGQQQPNESPPSPLVPGKPQPEQAREEQQAEEQAQQQAAGAAATQASVLPPSAPAKQPAAQPPEVEQEEALPSPVGLPPQLSLPEGEWRQHLPPSARAAQWLQQPGTSLAASPAEAVTTPAAPDQPLQSHQPSAVQLAQHLQAAAGGSADEVAPHAAREAGSQLPESLEEEQLDPGRQATTPAAAQPLQPSSPLSKRQGQVEHPGDGAPVADESAGPAAIASEIQPPNALQ